jgi:hypothetical protein
MRLALFAPLLLASRAAANSPAAARCAPALLSKLGAAMASSSSGPPAGLSDGCVGAPRAPGAKLPLEGTEALMARKGQFGSTAQPVQGALLYGIPNALASNICCFNRHYAEPRGSFVQTTFFSDVNKSGETTFYDSVTGRPLFVAPRGRTWAAFEQESRSHGWPSFRDEEVVWDDVRCLPDGECVSLAGTHLGHKCVWAVLGVRARGPRPLLRTLGGRTRARAGLTPIGSPTPHALSLLATT